MTRDEANAILRAHNPLKEADPEGFPTKFQSWVIDAVLEAVKAERSECAKVCDDQGDAAERGHFCMGNGRWARDCAAAIRARS